MTTKLTINNPELNSDVYSLRYIGPLIAERLRKENIKTLLDLKNTFNSQSRAQNIRLMRRVTINLRPQECVGEARYTKDPPNGMKPGYYTYCIRNYNRGAWYAIVTYLKRKNVLPDKLPDSDPPRGVREICSNKNKCIVKKVVPQNFKNKPMNELEHAIKILLDSSIPLSGVEIFNKSRLQNKKKMISVLKGNSGTHGRKIFKTINENDGSRIKWDLKSTVKRQLRGMSDKDLFSYLRKL